MKSLIARVARHTLSAAAIFLLLVPEGYSATVIAPNYAANTTLTGNNIMPFDTSAFSFLSSVRYQQVFDASEFLTSIPLGGLITQISFRPATVEGSAFSSTLPSIRIDLSTTTKAPDGLSATFADNIGANDTTVFGVGALTLSSAYTGPAGGPKNFDIVITFASPFFYDPTLGNLLLDVRNFGAGTTTPFASVGAVGDSTSRVTTFEDGPNAVNSPTASVTDSVGLITKFTIVPAPVPEPSAVLLVAFGFASILLCRFCNGRNA